MHILVSIFSLVISLVVGVFEGVFWVFHALGQGLIISHDAIKARSTLHQGVLHCPRGHPIPTEGEDQVFECQSCGYTYSGSVWQCQNPECGASITPYTDCPTCGLSVRNPYRLGRP